MLRKIKDTKLAQKLKKVYQTLLTVRKIKKREKQYTASTSLSSNKISEKNLQQIKKKGFTVIPDFLDKDTCEQLRQEIDRMMQQYPEAVWTDDSNSDHRIYGADRASNDIFAFGNNPVLLKFAEQFMDCPIKNFFTLAGKIVPKKGGLGSGGGWHRDSMHSAQMKSIVYLTDVDEDNGPYQYIEGSNSLYSELETILRLDFDFAHNRLSNDEVNQVLRSKRYKKHNITGKAGTLILSNTRGIHRGKPIKKGVRYALTNYYYKEYQIRPKLKEKFHPYLKWSEEVPG